MSSSSSSSSTDTKKGTWSKEEDEILKAYVEKHGTRNWNEVSKNAGLIRCGKSCRLRWYNHLQPDVKKGPFSEEEKSKVFEFYIKYGEFKWSKLAHELPGRSDNDIKNFWNARKRKLEKLGLSPFPDNMEPDHKLNSSQQVEDSQEDEFNIPQLKFRKYPSIFDEINEKLLDVPNMFYNNVGSTSTLIDRVSSIIGTSHIHIPIALPSPCSYLPLPSPMMLDEKGKKPISLEDDVEANLDDFMDLIDFSNLEDDVEAGSRLFDNDDI
ncbi:putative transcription factor MYB-HB-like family [Medicago truncatula]|uniref:Myb DNA-binding domain protein n=1 Tax=Medicago truncatula TaxID=3880 RepID=G7K312_MEDTR|nr:transcription factor MYB101 [Medicago truncatula]XP_013454321.1 transcription factor MYB101 [Medicago truncatula]AET00077.1 myb DNA-binding domain protein [Medicago truncatula]AET00084.1 myb DNA-binding domain protein [Medicago truncatula]KEH28352.1 myb DNA-binding domain protein [Medicago truncatula]RHN57473.1 putative transcription factor MYB-HB-like family [Medicago truncatula]